VKKYRITVKGKFSSAHFLRGYKGKCEALHGHNYLVECTIEGKEVDGLGMLMDFNKLKNLLSEVLNELDHKNLNDLPPFKEKNPTAENIAEFIYREMKDRIPTTYLLHIKVWETDENCAEYGDL
jgi:6-pyruvoyltetrahydropterin/6-carboxytetrahydropterin synthase